MVRWMLAFVLLLVSMPVMAAWQLDGERSSLHYVSVKKNSVGELNQFRSLSGTIAGGEASLKIDLASVDSGIDIRDKRMREKFFETAKFQEATVTVDVPQERIADLEAGDSALIDTVGVLFLHGQEKELDALLSVARLQGGDLLVNSARPLLIDASDFALAKGVEKLREIAGLPSISPVVPVTFSLHYSAQ